MNKYTIYDAQGLAVGATDDNSPELPPGYYYRETASAEQYRQQAKDNVKQQAAALINASAWRLERAREQETIGRPSRHSSVQVLAYREAIRRASNRAEAELDKLEDDAAVQTYQLTVLPEDYPPISTISPLTFVRRFNGEERRRLNAARATDPVLDDWLHLLTYAQSIDLQDQDTIAMVQHLEEHKLIDTGRSAEILRREQILFEETP